MAKKDMTIRQLNKQQEIRHEELIYAIHCTEDRQNPNIGSLFHQMRKRTGIPSTRSYG